MSSALFISLCFATAFIKTVRSDNDESPLLLVVAYDGLRYDFVNELQTPNLWKLAKKGVWAPQGMKNQVVTVTAPTFQTIATGLYQENHGIVGNSFYDPTFNEFFDYWNRENETLFRNSLLSKWYTGEPIWQTNEKAGKSRKSGAMRWPMCDARMNNIDMIYCVPWKDYREMDEWKQDLNQLLSWYVRPKDPINMGLFYVSEPDHTEHGNDLYSDAVRAKISELDALTGYMVQRLERLKLWDRMNIIFTSDHGHVNVFTEHNTLDLDRYIDPNDYFWSSKSLFLTNHSKLTVDKLYTLLDQVRMKHPKFQMWRKDDIPEKFHYKNNRRIGPIFIQEFSGYVLISHNDKNATPPPQASMVMFGTHGFSNEYMEMRPFFVAIGPSFKSKYTMSTEFENIDLYNLMCAILHIQPKENDGNLSRVVNMLTINVDSNRMNSKPLTSFDRKAENAGINLKEHASIIAWLLTVLIFRLFN